MNYYVYYCAQCLSPLMGGPVRPAPSEIDGGLLALVRISHGMKGNRRFLRAPEKAREFVANIV